MTDHGSYCTCDSCVSPKRARDLEDQIELQRFYIVSLLAECKKWREDVEARVKNTHNILDKLDIKEALNETLTKELTTLREQKEELLTTNATLSGKVESLNWNLLRAYREMAGVSKEAADWEKGDYTTSFEHAQDEPWIEWKQLCKRANDQCAEAIQQRDEAEAERDAVQARNLSLRKQIMDLKKLLVKNYEALAKTRSPK